MPRRRRTATSATCSAVLYLAFDEADAVAHAGDYPGYLRVLRRYDAWLRALDREIRARAAAGTPVSWLITTDHGRGRGGRFREHRWNVPGTRELWLFASGPGVAARGAIDAHRTYSLHDVRPTAEHLLGLAPTEGWLRGRVIEEILVEPSDRSRPAE